MRIAVRLTSALLLLGALAAPTSANDIIPGGKQEHPILLKGGNLYTVSGGIQPATDLLFDNGRITRIGPRLVPPQGTEIIDVTGQNIYPGLIDAYTSLGLVEIGAVRATVDISEVGTTNPDVLAEIAYNPDSEILPTVRANGITTALVVPGGGLVMGRSSLMNLDGWTREDAAEKHIVALHINWPAVAIVNAWWSERSVEDQKREIANNTKALDRLFDDARAYDIARKADPSLPIDSRWEAMRTVLTGELPVIISAHDSRQIEHAVAFSKKEGFRMILAGGRESGKVASLLKVNHIPVIYGNVNELPMRTDDDYDEAFKIPGELARSGIEFCIATFDTWNARNLPFQAGYSAAFGLTKEDALKAITISPAKILGVDKDLGSLEIGKKATIVVSKGDILDMSTAGVTLEFIEGRKVDLNSKHTELYRKYQAKHWTPPAH
jgi:imidazolonepropionase-like amidohydrolase